MSWEALARSNVVDIRMNTIQKQTTCFVVGCNTLQEGKSIADAI